MRLAYQYRFYPTDAQAGVLARTFGCVRYVYNFGLALRRDAYAERGECLHYKDTSAALTQLKRQEETNWLKEVSCVPLQQTLRHLDRAFTNFFRQRARYPNFKCKHARQSAEYTRSAFTYGIGEDGFPVLTLAKIPGPLRVVWSRKPPGSTHGAEPSTVTVSRDPAGRYFVSLLCEVEPAPLPPTDKAAGIDLGITDLVVTSDGEKIGNPRSLEADLRKLRRAQRRLSRKEQGSNRWRKQKRRLARIHARIADRRRDFLHKLSTRLIRENQTVCLEDLNVAGMMRNRHLARHIGGAGWRAFARQLEYKAERYGRTVVRIGRFEPTSKRCSKCKHEVKELPLSVRVWTCERCGTRHDRDVNAALNILAVGQAVGTRQRSDARGGSVSPGAGDGLPGRPGDARIFAL